MQQQISPAVIVVVVIVVILVLIAMWHFIYGQQQAKMPPPEGGALGPKPTGEQGGREAVTPVEKQDEEEGDADERATQSPAQPDED